MSQSSVIPLNGLTFNMIGEGTLSHSLDLELQKIVDDLESRGDDGKVRKIKMTLEFSKVGGQVKVNPSIESNLPKVLPAITMGSLKFDPITRKTVILFNANALNVDQKTVDDILEQNDRLLNPKEYRPGDGKPNADRPKHPELNG